VNCRHYEKGLKNILYNKMSIHDNSPLNVQETRIVAKHAKRHGFSPMLFKSTEKCPNWPKSENPSDKWTNATDEKLWDFIQGKSGNIGIRTGKHSNYLIIFDCDLPRNGDKEPVNGVKEFTSFLKNNGLITKDITELDTVIDKSGSGGIRVYFRYDPETVLSKKYFGLFKDQMNVDVLGDGKACIYPGSRYPGCSAENDKEKHKCPFETGVCDFKWAPYEWIKSPENFNVAPLPESLVKFFQQDKEDVPSIDEKSFKPIYDGQDVKIVKKMLKLVNDSAWDVSYPEWILLVWALIKFGFGDEDIHMECSRSEKYKEDSTTRVIDSYVDKPYTYGPKSGFYKWLESNLKEGINKYTLKMLLPSIHKLSKYDEKTINRNLFVEDKGIANMFYYFWSSENLKTWGGKGHSSKMVIWNDATKLWEPCDYTVVFDILTDTLIPKLWAFYKNLENSTDELDQAKKIQITKIIKNLNRRFNEKVTMTTVSNDCADPFFYQNLNKSLHEIATCDGNVIDLKTKQVRPRTSKDLWTICSPGKLIPLRECEEADKFLNEISCGNVDLKEFLQCLMGYCLTREVTERKLFILYGNGRNGKSVFSSIMSSVMGKFYQSARDSLLLSRGKKHSGTATPEMMNLMDARLAVIPEIDSDEKLDTVNVKTLTSGDEVSGRPLFENEITFELQSKFWILTNDKPNFKGSDPAMVDRIFLIPFDAKFQQNKKNTDYVTRLKGLVDQFFTLAVYGAYNYYKNGGLPDCEKINLQTKEYVEEMDQFGQFIEENIIKQSGSKILSKDLAIRFYNIDNPTKSQIQTINSEFVKKGFVKGRGSKSVHIENIKFIENE